MYAHVLQIRRVQLIFDVIKMLNDYEEQLEFFEKYCTLLESDQKQSLSIQLLQQVVHRYRKQTHIPLRSHFSCDNCQSKID